MTNDTYTKKNREAIDAWLDSYRAKAEMHDRMLSLIESADARLTDTTASYEETISSGSAHDAICNSLAAIEKHKEKLEQIDAAMSAAMDDIVEVIALVGEIDPVAGMVISNRYLCEGEPPDYIEIGERIGYSRSTCEKKCGDGKDIAYAIVFGQKECKKVQASL